MSAQTVQTSVDIEWDDGVVLVFSFAAAGGKMFCGFAHQVLALVNLAAHDGTEAIVDPLIIVQETWKNRLGADFAHVLPVTYHVEDK